MTISCAARRIRPLPLAFALAVSGCATVARQAPPASVSPAPPTTPAVAEAPCAHGTLGIEPGDLTRGFRESRRLPADLAGAVVTSVLPGGPAARAGIRAGDVLLQIGDARVATSCDATDALFDGRCDPVRIVALRDGARFEATVRPAEQQPFLERSCGDGVNEACFRLAWLVWNGSGVGKNEDEALALYDTACAKGSSEACAYLGIHLAERGAPVERAVATLTRSCDLGSSAGCAHLAYLYATGSQVERDDARATPLYVRSCDLGDARGCYNAGLMYRDGRGVPSDLPRAVAAYEEGCRGGSSTACCDLGWYYENGRGVGKDESRAAELYRKACQGTSCQPANRRACVNLGLAYRDGIGVAKDRARAAEIFEAACEDEVDSEDVDPEESQAHACSLLGAMALVGGGIEADPGRGLGLSTRGCDGGDAFGCFNAAAAFANGLGVAADLARAAGYYERACEYDDAESCHALGLLYDTGKGVARDRDRARSLFEKACAGGFTSACRSKKER